MDQLLQQPLRLACGVELPNRLAKSAMSEQLGNLWNQPTPGLIHLYDRWAKSGVGLLITGNIMVEALQSDGVDVIGLARPLALAPEFPKALLAQTTDCIRLPVLRTGSRALDHLGMLERIWYTQQIQRLAAGKEPQIHRNIWLTLLAYGFSTTLLHGQLQTDVEDGKF